MPDPSAIRVGNDYFVATSSFEWFPTIPFHRSHDLATWTFAGSLTAPLDLRGVASSEGVWAPSLSHAAGRFWLVFTVVRSMGGRRTYITRSDSIEGPWDEPVRVRSTGFDPALFHENGRVWLLNLRWDARPGRNHFAGITLQELDASTLAELEEPRLIHRGGTLLEGPNLYHRDGWYWLALAEGGTGWEHGILVLRSHEIGGPYTPDPNGPLITTRLHPGHPVQKAGHGELVTSPEGRTFLVHLGSRVTRDGDERMSLFGRETFVQPVEFDAEGWPRLEGGGTLPLVRPPVAPAREESSWGTPAPQWPWSTLRRPADEAWTDAASRPGWLSLRGGDGLESLFEQSLVARRVREAGLRFSVEVEAVPTGPDQLAGIHVFYDTETWAMLAVTADNAGMRELVLIERDLGSPERELARIPAPDGPLTLELTLAEGIVRFSCGTGPVGGGIPFSRFSDDHGDGLRFTGPMVGVTAIDVETGVWSAAFGPPTYIES